MNSTKTLTVKAYADMLEHKGYLMLGEPCVHYSIIDGVERLTFYLDYGIHNVHVVLSQTSFVKDKSQVLNAVFNTGVTKNTYPTLTQFVKQFGDRSVVNNELEPIERNAALLGKASRTKLLTYSLAKKILDKDVTLDGADKDFRYDRMHALITGTFDAIGRPEQLAYLSRLTYFPQKEAETFFFMPMPMMERSFGVPDNQYDVITLPAVRHGSAAVSTSQLGFMSTEPSPFKRRALKLPTPI